MSIDWCLNCFDSFTLTSILFYIWLIVICSITKKKSIKWYVWINEICRFLLFLKNRLNFVLYLGSSLFFICFSQTNFMWISLTVICIRSMSSLWLLRSNRFPPPTKCPLYPNLGWCQLSPKGRQVSQKTKHLLFFSFND